jgi:citrate/tricarballylate utilization protein
MLDEEMLSEANRQFTLCNACRYCEGLCSVFPAMELRTTFEQGDVAYLANLCHDCRACLDVCPFSAPHEYAIDIPSLMSSARSRSFEHFARPRALWRLLTQPWSAAGAVAIGLVFFAVVSLATGDPGRIVRAHGEGGSFYHVVAYLWIVLPAGAVSVCAAAAILAGAHSFSQQTSGGARRLLSGRANARAAVDALGLRNLRGGGGGCRYPGDTVSGVRRRLHHLVFYGFGLMFVATVSAAFEQEILRRPPPYPLLSVPVITGTSGGAATVAGCLGFLVLGLRGRDGRKTEDARRLDRTFAAMLLAATLTGLLTLGLRSTRLMGPALIVHLGVLGGLFLSFPYGKLVHGAYRYVALVRSHVEQEQGAWAPETTEPVAGEVLVNPVLDPAGNLDA